MVKQATHPSTIPAEALARQNRLQQALGRIVASGPSREAASLQRLRNLLEGGGEADPATLLPLFQAEDLCEEAQEILRASRREHRDQGPWNRLSQALAPLAARAQARRAALWQLDTRRTLIRFGYTKGDEAEGFDDGDVHAMFLLAFRLEGLCLALDLGKRPRPLLSVGLPLPAGVGSDVESMDLVLKREPLEETATLLERLNLRLPAGLSIHRWECLPAYASPLCDLALLSRWQWRVPADLHGDVADKVARFHGAEPVLWRRDPSKPGATVDLRLLVPELTWREGTLCFATRMGSYQAINPLKVLAALLELDMTPPGTLVRTAIELKPDLRLDQADRFQPKLKNMYEDAVLLGGASNITLVDEDDDEPLRLG